MRSSTLTVRATPRQLQPPFTGSITSLAVPALSKKTAEVYKFLNFVASVEAQDMFVKVMKAIPVIDTKKLPAATVDMLSGLHQAGYRTATLGAFGTRMNERWSKEIATLSFSDTWFSRTVSRLYLIPRFCAAMNVVRDTGALNRILVQLFGIDFKPGLMFTPQGITLANCWFNIPFSVMLIGARLQGIPRSIIDSARAPTMSLSSRSSARS